MEAQTPTRREEVTQEGENEDENMGVDMEVDNEENVGEDVQAENVEEAINEEDEADRRLQARERARTVGHRLRRCVHVGPSRAPDARIVIKPHGTRYVSPHVLFELIVGFKISLIFMTF